eukprot:CAMPEP_0198127960 /NCGR_PEP_ID=MMETSP1442-20131203/48311_1 /TAXON_ID= /ORGANISM="Craspedostauros australis, Strain CCMP3328" /LENGTH=88 /DNA_ID=CAMNT_0043788035 /DNA_START=592 /DNA_END=855 /DNA_ORIENTATION=+
MPMQGVEVLAVSRCAAPLGAGLDMRSLAGFVEGGDEMPLDVGLGDHVDDILFEDCWVHAVEPWIGDVGLPESRRDTEGPVTLHLRKGR